MAERLPSTDAVLPTKAAAKPSPQQPDLLSKFLVAHDARPAFMSDTLVQTMAVSMAFAGSETTAISLSAVFYYLLRNPACLEKLRVEIDDAAKSGAFSDYEGGIVTFAESQKLKYLDACIKEAFRMHPAAGLPLERIVPPSGADIAGHFVKGGTVVGCSAWVIHRNKEVFGEDVETYRPERWLVGEGRGKEGVDVEGEERRIRGMDGCMIQFGMGSRTCIGKNISLLEIYKLVPSFLRRFEVSPISFSPFHHLPLLSLDGTIANKTCSSSSRTRKRSGASSTRGSSSRSTSRLCSRRGRSCSPRRKGRGLFTLYN